MAKLKKLLIGEGSSVSSDYSVFEHFPNLEDILNGKLITRGGYFCVGQVSDKKRFPTDIGKINLFVCGFRPYNVDEKFNISSIENRRRYSRLVVCILDSALENNFTATQIAVIKSVASELVENEYRFNHAQVYKMLGSDLTFSLEMQNLEWLVKNKTMEIFSSIIKEKEMVMFSGDSSIYLYEPKEKSRGHFLAGHKYVVRSVMVGMPDSDGAGYEKRIICMDLLCGVPGIVYHNPEEFTKIE